MNDAELQGLAAQALNLAKRDIEHGTGFAFLFAAYHKDEGMMRMSSIERIIARKLGKNWLDDDVAKDIAYGLLRMAILTLPPDAVIIVSGATGFEPTEAGLALPEEKQEEIRRGDLHQAVRDGYAKPHNVLVAIAQTPERVCSAVQDHDFSNPV